MGRISVGVAELAHFRVYLYTFRLNYCINIHFSPCSVLFVCMMSVIHENKAFSACFIVWRCNYIPSYIKVDLCAHTDS